MRVDSNTATKTKQVLVKEDLDTLLYTPLEGVIAATPFQPRFDRVYDPVICRKGIDVILTEKGGFTSYIAEKPAWSLDGKKAFSFELSYTMDNCVEAGWLLDTTSQTTFFMVCGCQHQPDANDRQSLYAMLISKQKLLGALESVGYDRQALAIRDDLIRKTGKPGIYNTAYPEIWFRYNAAWKTRPINLMIQTSFLTKIATADICVEYNNNKEEINLSGRWLNHRIEHTQSA